MTLHEKLHAKLAALGLTLPDPPAPVAAYLPSVTEGKRVWISGQLPLRDGELIASGPVPSVVGPELAAEAARQCALNALAVLGAAVDSDFDRLERIVRIGVYVCSDPRFGGQPAVANGASELLAELLGEAGRHARAAVGSMALPLDATVELEMTAQLR